MATQQGAIGSWSLSMASDGPSRMHIMVCMHITQICWGCRHGPTGGIAAPSQHSQRPSKHSCCRRASEVGVCLYLRPDVCTCPLEWGICIWCDIHTQAYMSHPGGMLQGIEGSRGCNAEAALRAACGVWAGYVRGGVGLQSGGG
jgi:hypothetical protein